MLGVVLFAVLYAAAVAESDHEGYCRADEPCEDQIADISKWGEYSLTNLPTRSSAVVLSERDSLLGSVDFGALAKDFRKLSVLAGDASRESTAFGDGPLQNHVHGLASDVSALFGKSTETVAKFMETTEVALQQLTTVFKDLSDNHGDNSLEVLGKVSVLAEDMAKLSEGLYADSETDRQSAQNVLEEVMTAKGVVEQKRSQLESKRKELHISKSRMEELQKSALEAERKAQEMARQAEEEAARARKRRRRRRRGFFKRIVHEVGKVVGHDNTKKYKKQEAAAREEQRKFNEQSKVHHDQYMRAVREAEGLEKEIKSVQFDTEHASSTIGTLHNLVGTFKSLSTTTHKVVDFWKNLQLHCQDLQNPVVKRDVEEVGSHSADHVTLWTSPAFQARAVRLYSRWLVLQGECLVYMDVSHQIQDQSAK